MEKQLTDFTDREIWAELESRGFSTSYWSYLDVEHTVEQMIEDNELSGKELKFAKEMDKGNYIEIMGIVDRRFDAEAGVRWDVIQSHTEDYIKDNA